MALSFARYYLPACYTFIRKAPLTIGLGIIISSVARSPAYPNVQLARQDKGPEPDPAEDGSAENKEEPECPLCKMVKAGPCKHMFYPFENCLDKAHADGNDAAEACREPFAEMMQCIQKFRKEYEAITEQHAGGAEAKATAEAAAAKKTAEQLAQRVRAHSEEYDDLEEAREAAFFAAKPGVAV
mmetsp:Transcript_37137/g.75344  ORF Transcript_37137/g.75344 Transcript_37137/m.75344 type:complete len:184 (-) Transcript_37137:183-734(-)